MQLLFENWRRYAEEEDSDLLNERKGPRYVFKDGKYQPLKRKYKKWERKKFEKVRKYDDAISRASKRTGLSKAFIYGTIYTESGGNPNVQGPNAFNTGRAAKERGRIGDSGSREGWRRKAQGLTQVAWFVAKEEMKRGTISREDYRSGKWRTDPEMNILVGSSYIARQKRRLLSPKRMRYGAWKQETPEQARKRAENVRNMSEAELESLLHVAFSHGPHHSLTKKIATKGYGSITDKGISSYNYPRISQTAKDLLAEVEPVSDVTTPTTDVAELPQKTDKKYVVISGNSHASGHAEHIKRRYEILSQKTGIEYEIVRIDAVQGKGGGVARLTPKMEALRDKLKAENANVAAVIHIGTNKVSDKQFDELVDGYKSMTDNVTFIGSPRAKSGYKAYTKREKWNKDLQDKLKEKNVNYINTWDLTSDEDLYDNVHLKSGAYARVHKATANSVVLDKEAEPMVGHGYKPLPGHDASTGQARISVSSPFSDKARAKNRGRADMPKADLQRAFTDYRQAAPTMPAGPGEPAGGRPPVPATINIGKSGEFVHGYNQEDLPKFKFDKFYSELDKYFADEGGAEGILTQHGKDYKYGNEHNTARDMLEKRKAELADTVPEPGSLAPGYTDPKTLGTGARLMRTPELAAQQQKAFDKEEFPSAGEEIPAPIEDTLMPPGPGDSTKLGAARDVQGKLDWHINIYNNSQEELMRCTTPDCEDLYRGEMKKADGWIQGNRKEIQDLGFEPGGGPLRHSGHLPVAAKPEAPTPDQRVFSLEDRELASGPSVPSSDNAAMSGFEDMVKDIASRSPITAPLMSIINEEYTKLLKEVASFSEEKQVIKVDLVLRFEKVFTFYGNVLNQIRAIAGITIAKADESGLLAIYPDKQAVLLHLKFIPDRPLNQYLVYLRSELLKIKDNTGDKIIAIDFKNIPHKAEL
tara:strand:+ start:2055 stop:4832 length:2778 start_codon:yes stop_codon:yes gene_type:complete